MPARSSRPTAPPGVAPKRLEPAARAALIFERLAALRPDPHTELAYRDPFTLLVAVVLSAQATDAGVNRATPALFAAAPTPAAMVELGEEGIRERIKTIGLFRTKARNLLALARKLVDEHGGVVPRDREALEKLPGVGRKTANVVLNEAFGEPTIAVDTHVFRVANRTGIAPGKTPLEVERKLLEVVPERFRKGAHHWLILHGRYICTARRPACARCPIADLCDYHAASGGGGDGAAGGAGGAVEGKGGRGSKRPAGPPRASRQWASLRSAARIRRLSMRCSASTSGP